METLTKNPSIPIAGIQTIDSPMELITDTKIDKTDKNDIKDKKKQPKKTKPKAEKVSDVSTDDIKQLSNFFIAQQKDNANEDIELEVDDLDSDSEEQLKKDKLLVYAHPLFPLLALIFEKCELATHSLNAFETDASLKCCDAEIVSFIEQHQKSGIPLFTDRPEVDSLMIRSIQVFRIQLLELEKVSDLCTDFCARYTSCLKGKMSSDVLLRGTSLDDGLLSNSADNIDVDGEEDDCCLLDRKNNDCRSSVASSSGSSCDEEIVDDKPADKKPKLNDPPKIDPSLPNFPSQPSAATLFNTSFSFSSPPASPSCSLSSAKSLRSGSPSGSEVSSPFSPHHDTDSSTSGQNAHLSSLLSGANRNFSIEHLLSLNDLKVRSDGASLPINFAELLQAQIALSNAAGLIGSTGLPFPPEMALPNLPHLRPSQASTQSAVDLTVKRVKRLSDGSKSRPEIASSDCGSSGSSGNNNAKIKFSGNEGEKGRSSKKFGIDSKRDKTSKRGILPKQATAIMRTWLFQHIVHPYPTEDEKRTIAAETKLTMLQVNNWFINARRRILQPMLDSANTLQSELCKSTIPPATSETTQPEVNTKHVNNNNNNDNRPVESSKKLKSQNNSQQLANAKFWSQSLANILQTSADLNG